MKPTPPRRIQISPVAFRAHLSLGTWLLVALVAAVVALLVVGGLFWMALRAPASADDGGVYPPGELPRLPPAMCGTWRVDPDEIERARQSGASEESLRHAQTMRLYVTPRSIEQSDQVERAPVPLMVLDASPDGTYVRAALTEANPRSPGPTVHFHLRGHRLVAYNIPGEKPPAPAWVRDR